MSKKSRKNPSKRAICIVAGNASGAHAGLTPETAAKRLAGRAAPLIR
jgi:hypothetical protein